MLSADRHWHRTAGHGRTCEDPAVPSGPFHTPLCDLLGIRHPILLAGMAGGYTTPVNLASLTSGSSIFKGAGCTACHTLKAAGSTGTIGPNLDQLASALTLSIVIRQVTNGGAIMPPFKDKLSAAQIEAVAAYVSSVAGK